MKILAIGLNTIVLVTITWLFLSEKHANIDGKDVFIYVLFFTTPISSLLALLLSGGESWLGLFFKRKAL